jgi:hypothetical protein
MGNTGTPDNPLSGFSAREAPAHWTNGGGEDVYVSMGCHLTQGAGSTLF